MAFLSHIKPARDLFFVERNAPAAETSLKHFLSTPESPEEMQAVQELMAWILRAQNKFEEAYRLYLTLEDDYQAGYCAMLQGDLQKVQMHWGKILSKKPTHWCVSLYGMITGQLRTYPTLFQIRNHMESDIANFITANQLGYLENMLTHVDLLTQLNLEAPKFAGRALLNAGWVERAGPFLLKGQKSLPNDPEIYFHLGQYSVAMDHAKEARMMLKQCLLISPTYLPAKELLNQIGEGN